MLTRGRVIALAAITLVWLIILLFYTNGSTLGAYTFMVFGNTEKSAQSIQEKSCTRFPRILCMIFITVGGWPKKGEAARRTWTRHCYRRLFFFSKGKAYPKDIPARMLELSHELVPLDVPEGRHFLTPKTMTALDYSFRKFQNETDWYMKADDDTYIIYENLINYLTKFDPQKPAYLGMKIYNMIPKGYNSGGSGYLLSAAATHTVITKGRKLYPAICAGEKAGGDEDVDMGICLSYFNITPHETFDSEHRTIFGSQNPYRLISGALGESSDHMLEQYRSAKYQGMEFSNYNDTKRTRLLSNETISFHYVSPAQMFMYDFLLSLPPKQTPLFPLQCYKPPSHKQVEAQDSTGTTPVTNNSAKT